MTYKIIARRKEPSDSTSFSIYQEAGDASGAISAAISALHPRLTEGIWRIEGVLGRTVVELRYLAIGEDYATDRFRRPTSPEYRGRRYR